MERTHFSEPLQSSYQGDHQETAAYGSGYGPLQCSHQGDHHEIADYGTKFFFLKFFFDKRFFSTNFLAKKLFSHKHFVSQKKIIGFFSSNLLRLLPAFSFY